MTASWRVNSYGYPNPFTTTNAQRAWDIFETFLVFNSYTGLKKHYAPLGLDAHAVESWKANFEECGLLYVISREDAVHITPAGHQLKVAADAGDQAEFSWIGTNLLVRYRLRGTTGRRPRSAPHDTSDLMPYWFVLAAALELDGLWQTELFRIVGGVFKVADAASAVDLIHSSRAGSFDPLALPNLATKGAGYNALNQVAVKAGLNQLTLTKDSRPSPYGSGRNENFWRIRSKFRPIVELSLGGPPPAASGCAVASSGWIERMPSAPLYGDEQSHFAAVGAKVASLTEAQQVNSAPTAQAPTATLGAEQVFLLTVGVHCTRPSPISVEGGTATLCVIPNGGRVVLDEDLGHTYLVKGKTLLSGNSVRIDLQQARPIQNPAYVRTLFEGVASDGS